MYNRRKALGLDKIKVGKDGVVMSSGGVSCTYCGSNSVRKIGAVSRMVSGSLFGLGSSKIGKQWHCNSCGSDF